MATKPNDYDKFLAHMQTIKWQLNKDKVGDANAVKAAYNEWKNKWTVNPNTINAYKQPVQAVKVEPPITSTPWGDWSKQEWKIITAGWKTYKVINWKLTTYNKELTTKKESPEITPVENEAQAKREEIAKVDTSVWDPGKKEEWTFNATMDLATKNLEELKKKQAEELNINEEVYSDKATAKLKEIFTPALDAYKQSTEQFTKVLDEAMTQNKISLAEQKKIANNLREAAWVESMIAWSKVWAWMSQSQLQALSKDIAMWYQWAIAAADGNYEQARVNGWNNLKQMWMDWKMAQDLLTKVSADIWLQVAEPFLLALANQKTNINWVIDAVANLKTGTQTKLYEDTETKLVSKVWQASRAAEWEQWTPQERQAQLLTSLPEWLTIDPKIVKALVDDKNLDWNSVYANAWYLAKLDEQNRIFLLQQIANGKMTAKNAIEAVKLQSTIDQNKAKNIVDLQWQTEQDLNRMEEVKMTQLEELNKPKVTTPPATPTPAKEYKLSTNDKATLDKVKALSPTKKTEAIKRINESKYTAEQKAAMLKYINS